MVGSCSTLVAMRLLSDETFKMPDELALLLFGLFWIPTFSSDMQFFNMLYAIFFSLQNVFSSTLFACPPQPERWRQTTRLLSRSSNVGFLGWIGKAPITSSRKPSWTALVLSWWAATSCVGCRLAVCFLRFKHRSHASQRLEICSWSQHVHCNGLSSWWNGGKYLLTIPMFAIHVAAVNDVMAWCRHVRRSAQPSTSRRTWKRLCSHRICCV